MRSPFLVLAVLAAAVSAFSITFILNPPSPRYYPLEHAWRLAEPAPGPAMGWYGRSGAALLASALAGAAGGAIARRVEKSIKSVRSMRALAVILTLLIAVGLVAAAGAIVNEQLPWFHKAPQAPKINHEY
ncbi:MAG: hypothetical protein HZB26_13740 [Candidatus Hydrogenedentes bacterium]|nr:hypothetical protein [Candidatus Hydrogenedentota bacterium]